MCNQAFADLDLHVLQGVVGRREGKTVLYKSHNYHCHTIKAQMRYTGSKRRTVSYVDLDVLYPDEKWDLIKCDIEGAREEFVENYAGLLTRTKRAVFEFHESSCDTQRIRSLLRHAGLEYEQTISDRAGVK